MRCSWNRAMVRKAAAILAFGCCGAMAADYPNQCGAGEDMKVDGKVAIGKSTPSYWLDVDGAMKADTLKLTVYYYGSPASVATVRVDAFDGFIFDGAIKTAYDINVDDVICNVVSCDRVVADSVETDKVKINNWTIEAPDYVFEEDYPLRSLSEVEEHVREHKHLPDVPSAVEMTEDGVDLAELNMALLRKVEELTLYAIEQDERLRHQSREIQELREHVEAQK